MPFKLSTATIDFSRKSKIIMLSTTFLLIAVVIIGSIISFIIQISHIDDNHYESEVFKPPVVIDPSHDSVIMGDNPDHLMWFMQISDIHLSYVFDPKRIPDFHRFCSIVVDSVKPSVVLATGDLTDARTAAPFGSNQFEQEWKWYANTLNSSRVTEKTVWLDMRGNHDAFNVYSWNSSNNFYRKYSQKGNRSEGHYLYTLVKGGDTYNFLGFDAALQPSPKRPYNFIGYLKTLDLDFIKNLLIKAPPSNSTIFFGHYPTSSIITQTPGLRNLITGPYLCGHFHTIAGLVPKMYATQSTGYLEIEVADWKDERMFRVAAVDHGLFNFVDVKLEQWPIILITNPKTALYKMPRYEPLHRIANSTHIRVLAFSPSPVDTVSLSINDQPWVTMKRFSKDQPLFTYPWNPNKYSIGLHKIEIRASDEHGHENTETVQFSLDKSKPDFPFISRFLLRVSTRSFLQCMFMFMVFIAIFPLFTMRFLHLIEKGPVIKYRARSSLIYKVYLKFMLLSSIDHYFYTMMIIPLYALTGPWFIGDLLDGQWGVTFAWGMYIDGHWIPIGLPYLFGSINMILFHIPLVFWLSHIVHKKYVELSSRSKEKIFTWSIYFKPRHIIFSLMLICDVLFNFSICMAYGAKSLIFGFERFWVIFVYLYVWWTSFDLDQSHFKTTEQKKDTK